jgi:hypothetical protein
MPNPHCAARRVACLAVAVLAAVVPGSPAQAAETYLAGTISNITTGPTGMRIMLDTGLPTNCTGTPYGWMLIRQEDKAMVAAALAMWFSGQRNVVVYTSAYTGNGYCTINQLDPD